MKQLGFVPVLLLLASYWLLATSVADEPIPPYKRVLSAAQAKRVADLQREIASLTDAGKFLEAQKPAEEVLQIRTTAQGKDHWETVNARFALKAVRLVSQQPAVDQTAYARLRKLKEEANRLVQKRLYSQAQPLLMAILETKRQVLSEEHTDTANSYNNVGFVLDMQRKHVEARLLYDKALAIHRTVLGAEHPDTANSYNNIAANLCDQSRYAEAQPFLERSLAICRRVLGDAHLRTAACYNGAAVNLNEQGKYAEAQPLFEKALAIRRQALHEEHRDTAESYNNVATNLNAQGKYAQAQPLYEKALSIRRRVLGEEDPDTAGSYNNVAFNLNAQGNYAQAQPLYEKALAIRRQVLGEEHADTAGSYNNVAFNLNAQGRYAEAQPLYEKALAINRKVLGENHPGTATSYNGLAFNLHAQREYAAAQPLYEKGLAINHKVLGDAHPDTAQNYDNVAFILNDQGKYAEAQPLFEKALAIFRQVLGEEHPITVQIYTNVAFNLHDQGKSREAIALWQAAARASEITRLHAADTGFGRSRYRANWISPHEALAAALAPLKNPSHAWQHSEAYLARGLLDDLNPASRKAIEASARLAKINELLGSLIGQFSLSEQARSWRDLLSQEIDALRKAVIQAAAERSAKQIWPLEKIQPTIPADAAIVLWLDVRKEHWACILRHSGQPIWQRLAGTGPDKRWTKEDNTLPQRSYEAALVRPNHPERDKLLAALRAQRLDPLLPHLQGIRHLLVVPTDDMAKIPLEALTDQLLVSYIPSASIYAQWRQKHRPLEGRSLLALGNPVYSPTTTS